MDKLATKIIAEGLSVRATEEIVALSQTTTEKTPQRVARPRTENPRGQTIAAALSDRFDTRVTVDIGASRGKIVIQFAGEDDLDRILDLITTRQSA